MILLHVTHCGDLVNQVALQVSRLCIVDFVVLLGIQATEHVVCVLVRRRFREE